MKTGLLEPGIPGRACDPLGPGLDVRAVTGDGELDDVHRLVHDAYVRSGYIEPRPGGRLLYCSRLEAAPETTVFAVYSAGRIVGPSTVTLDGPEGFHLDGEYPREVVRVRGEGRKLAASWRLAVTAPGTSRMRILLALVRANQDLFHREGVETCLFTLVPHLGAVYRRILLARRVAFAPPGRGCESESLEMFRCSTVLMRWDRESCPTRWRGEVPEFRYGRRHGQAI